MNWDDLSKLIQEMTPEQRETDVTAFVDGHYYLIRSIQESGEADVLDKEHPFLSDVNLVIDSYANGVCPDCHELIPVDVENGSACQNCGHVFWSNSNTGLEDASL